MKSNCLQHSHSQSTAKLFPFYSPYKYLIFLSNLIKRMRVSELIFVLQQLKELELPFNCFKKSSEQIQ